MGAEDKKKKKHSHSLVPSKHFSHCYLASPIGLAVPQGWTARERAEWLSYKLAKLLQLSKKLGFQILTQVIK